MVRIQCIHGIEAFVTPLLLVLLSRLKDENAQHVTRSFSWIETQPNLGIEPQRRSDFGCCSCTAIVQFHVLGERHLLPVYSPRYFGTFCASSDIGADSLGQG